MAGSYLSKSLFIRGRQCHKSLWLHKHNPELKDEVSDAQEAVFQSGTEVGILAQQLFPAGVEVSYEGLSHAEQVDKTRELMAAGIETIYEATFLHVGIFVKVDILHHGKRGWEILEVKASTEVKDVHCFDAALQYHVLAGAGLDVARVAIVHINNRYVRHGELDVRQLFTIDDITGDVQELQPFVVEEIAAQREMLAGEMPVIGIGPQCDDPYPCDFQGHCWRHIPEDSVFDLRGRGADRFGLYRQGVVRQTDIPLDILNDSQRQQVEATLQQRDTINREAVSEFLASLNYPLYFLDFETVNPAVPLFDGCRPYQQLPFQYSLHILEHKGAMPIHHAYLARPGVDPREEILGGLLAQIPVDGSIIAWNQGFEIGVLRGLAEFFPQHAAPVGRMIDRFFDLMAPFRSRAVYLWKTKGSYSIKAVLPILVPELSYDGMAVADGGMAMDAYHRMCATDDVEEAERIRTALLEYCRLDTLAMVRILERLKEL